MTRVPVMHDKRWLLLACLIYFVFVDIAPSYASEWIQLSNGPTLTVYWREVEDSSVPEFKAVGIIDAAPSACWSVIQGFAEYTHTMPFVRESRVVGQDSEGVYLYSIIDPGKFLVSPRDFTIKVVSDNNVMIVKWEIAENRGPVARDGYVRVKKNTGGWELQPLSNGMRTEVTYSIHTEPGGTLGWGSNILPNWVLAWANSDALPELFRHLAIAAEEETRYQMK